MREREREREITGLRVDTLSLRIGHEKSSKAEIKIYIYIYRVCKV